MDPRDPQKLQGVGQRSVPYYLFHLEGACKVVSSIYSVRKTVFKKHHKSSKVIKSTIVTYHQRVMLGFLIMKIIYFIKESIKSIMS